MQAFQKGSYGGIGSHLRTAPLKHLGKRAGEIQVQTRRGTVECPIESGGGRQTERSGCRNESVEVGTCRNGLNTCRGGTHPDGSNSNFPKLTGEDRSDVGRPIALPACPRLSGSDTGIAARP